MFLSNKPFVVPFLVDIEQPGTSSFKNYGVVVVDNDNASCIRPIG
jgi:hypothetical protein